MFLIYSPCLANEFDGNSNQLAKLTDLSLEELMNIEITSVSKQPETLADAAAAVYVITNEDIRRSGARSIPEALRMVPGLHVARIDANKWAIASRGFNDRFTDKLLVLIDGRTIYTPLFSGVYWEYHDLIVEDVERIEVIRGPGATLWGANAVNGVINIITKHAKDTQGGLITSGLGTEKAGFGSIRYGGKYQEDLFYRVYAKYKNHDRQVDRFGNEADDDWDSGHAGFRLDWEASEKDTLMVQGDAYDVDLGSSYRLPITTDPYWDYFSKDDRSTGAYFLNRWIHRYSDTSEHAFQVYYNWSEDEAVIGGENRHVLDLDFQHTFSPHKYHDLIWGLGYRYNSDDIYNTEFVSLFPPQRDDHLFSAFLQDDITLVDDRLKLTLGSKFEHNDYTGFEYQPTARLLWTPHEKHSIWATVSCAVRTPNRSDHNMRIRAETLEPGDPFNPFPLPVVAEIYGNEEIESENLLAYELGYRFLANDWLTLDVAAFYNVYDDLLTAEECIGADVPFTTGYLIYPLCGDNKMEGETYGLEFSLDTEWAKWWRTELSYSILDIQLHVDPDSGDIYSEAEEGSDPHHQFSIRSSMDVSRSVELDVWLRYVDALPNLDVPDYLTLDLRLGWQPTEKFDLSFVAQNLLDSHHAEFGSPEFIHTFPTEIERSVYVMVRWRF